MLRALSDLAAFVIQNGNDLLWVGGAAGGHNGRAAAAALVARIHSSSDDFEMIHDLVIVLRDALLSGFGHTNMAEACGRSDLDAALRWYGARLDEFAVRFA